MNEEFVFATGSQLVGTPDGGWHKVNHGEIRNADDPVVKAAPHLFTSDASQVAVSSMPPGYYDSPVEQVTAGPGEKRAQVRRG